MPTGAEAHTVPLPGTEWAVWRDALVRSAGFPADGFGRLDRARAAVAGAAADGQPAGVGGVRVPPNRGGS